MDLRRTFGEQRRSEIVIYATRCNNFEYIVPHRNSTYIYYNVVNIRTIPIRYDIFKIMLEYCEID